MREQDKWIYRRKAASPRDGHVCDRTHAKAKQNSLFHPGVCAPAGFRGSIRFGRANFTAVQRRFEVTEEPMMFFFVVSRSFVKQSFNSRWQHEPSRRKASLRRGQPIRAI